jgi:serine/threonine-protein kinase
MPLSQGQVVKNRYRVARLLGQGGMGAVYRAWDLSLNMPVALKEMVPEPGIDRQKLAELKEQFRREAQVLAGLHHPSLPRVTDFFEWSNNAYLVMDFVEGESLDELIARQGAQPEARVRRWAGQLLDALEACHARQIVHRDVKPQNIIIRSDGRAMLVDFGLVKLWDPHHPQTQRIIRGLGTLEYASPEHFNVHGRHTEPRSDLYSLGATLFHALTGREPPSALERWGRTARLQSPRSLGAAIAPETETIVTRAMALDVGQRFPSARDMRVALTGRAESEPRRPAGRGITGTDGAGPKGHPTGREPGHTASRQREKVRPTTSASSWWLEMGGAMVMAALGVLAIQIGLFARTMTTDLYVGRTSVALILGASGWFAGDLVFQAMTRRPSSPQPRQSNRPTERLVSLTRHLTQGLSSGQQISLLIGLLAVATLLSWALAPPLLGVPFVYDYVQFYAVIGPLAYAATGRRPGRAFVAHTLVVTLVGALFGPRLDVPQDPGRLFLVAAAGGALMEGVAYLTERFLPETER